MSRRPELSTRQAQVVERVACTECTAFDPFKPRKPKTVDEWKRWYNKATKWTR